MDFLQLIGSLNKISLLAFLITACALGYEIYLFRRDRNKKDTPNIPKFDEDSLKNATPIQSEVIEVDKANPIVEETPVETVKSSGNFVPLSNEVIRITPEEHGAHEQLPATPIPPPEDVAPVEPEKEQVQEVPDIAATPLQSDMGPPPPPHKRFSPKLIAIIIVLIVLVGAVIVVGTRLSRQTAQTTKPQPTVATVVSPTQKAIEVSPTQAEAQPVVPTSVPSETVQPTQTLIAQATIAPEVSPTATATETPIPTQIQTTESPTTGATITELPAAGTTTVPFTIFTLLIFIVLISFVL